MDFELSEEDMQEIAKLDEVASQFFNHYDPKMVEWFDQMVQSRRENHDHNKDKKTLDSYLEFLKLGSTKDPVASLKVASVDLTDDKVYKDAFNMLNEQMDKFEELI